MHDGYFLVFQGSRLFRWVLGTGVGVAVGLIGFSAHRGNPVAIFLVCSVTAGFFLLARLRHYRSLQMAAAGIWSGAITSVLLLGVLDGSVKARAALVAVLLAVFGVCWLIVLRACSEESPAMANVGQEQRWAVAMMTSTLGTPLAAILVWGLARYLESRDIMGFPRSLTVWLLIAAVGAPASALLIAGVASLIHPSSSVDLDVETRLVPPHTPSVDFGSERVRRRIPANAPGRRPIDLLQRHALRLRELVTKNAETVAAIVVKVLFVGIRVFVNVLERVRVSLVRTGRRVHASARFVVASFSTAIRVAIHLFGSYSRSLLLPVTALVAAAVFSWLAAAEAVVYLTGGPFVAAGRSALALGAVVAASFLAWWLWSGISLSEGLSSEVRTFVSRWPHFIYFLAGAGWLLSLAAWLGFGHIQMGPITYGSTFVIVLLLIISFVYREPATSESERTLPALLISPNRPTRASGFSEGAPPHSLRQSRRIAWRLTRVGILGAVVGGLATLGIVDWVEPTESKAAPPTVQSVPQVACGGASPPATTAGAEFIKPPPMRIDTKSRYSVDMSTSCGRIELRLFANKAPRTVNNFIFLARRGFYEGLTFHQIEGRFLQGGDPTGQGDGGPGYSLKKDTVRFKKFERPGMLAMGISGTRSNGSQFLITTRVARDLNGLYSIFGEVIEGMQTVRRIERVGGDPETGKPLQTVYILKVTVSKRKH